MYNWLAVIFEKHRKISQVSVYCSDIQCQFHLRFFVLWSLFISQQVLNLNFFEKIVVLSH